MPCSALRRRYRNRRRPPYPNPIPPARSAEARKEQRVKVSWPARIRLPDGRVVQLRLRDLSETGVGLLTEVNIPAYTVLDFVIGVPGLNDPTKITPVTGTIKTTYPRA